MRQNKFRVAVVGLLSLALLGGCNWLGARDNMNKGVQAYSASNFTAAADFFSTAMELDPEVPNAELYLALSYAGQFIPNFPTPENNQVASQAIATYESVLTKEPTNTTAIAGLAAIYQGQDDLDSAREYYLLQAEISPEDPVAQYSVGSINWNLAGNIVPSLVFPDAPPLPLTAEQEAMSEEELAADLSAQRERILTLIEEGQQALTLSLELNPDYEDAMTFKNLLYRMAAEMIPADSEDEEALVRKEELVAQADDWFAQALETRARNAEDSASQFGTVQD